MPGPRRWWATLLVVIVVLSAMPLTAAAQSTPLPNLGAPPFVPVWGRTDYPVADGKVKRSYYFGPSASLTCEELYKEAPNGRRLVTYLDKARLELSNPTSGTVTAGLLSKELISGKMQFGNDTFEDFGPANVPVAGDQGDTPAPTYASFTKVTTINPSENRATARLGETVVDTLTKAGVKGKDDSLARYGVTLAEYRDELGHNIPNVFVDFFKERGLIATIFLADGKISFSDNELLINWLEVLGLPIAEPYWAIVPVAAKPMWVLIQPFERRVITYTPDNDAAFRVEMGNIGAHYKTWRHPSGNCALRPTPAGPVGDPVPDGKSATINKRIGYWGTVFRATLTGFTPNESLSFWYTDPNGVVVGTRRPLSAQHSGTINNFPIYTDQSFPAGLWAFTMQGDKSNHQAIAYFRIVDRPALPAGAEPAPEGTNATVNPRAGWQGTVFRVTITGFTPNESMSFWFTAPDGRVSGTRQPVRAQHPGRLQNLPVFTDEEFQPGVWAVTFQGDASGHQAVGYFRVVG